MASKSKQIDKMIKSDQRKIQQEVKVLLLGAGESGKSTFLKQMKIIHGVVFETDELKELRRNIYQNCIKGMRVLVDAQRKLKIKLDNPINSQFGDQVNAKCQKSDKNSSKFVYILVKQAKLLLIWRIFYPVFSIFKDFHPKFVEWLKIMQGWH